MSPSPNLEWTNVRRYLVERDHRASAVQTNVLWVKEGSLPTNTSLINYNIFILISSAEVVWYPRVGATSYEKSCIGMAKSCANVSLLLFFSDVQVFFTWSSICPFITRWTYWQSKRHEMNNINDLKSNFVFLRSNLSVHVSGVTGKLISLNSNKGHHCLTCLEFFFVNSIKW